jgi:16S rRNA (uracil1498-N3)-methyltransferase
MFRRRGYLPVSVSRVAIPDFGVFSAGSVVTIEGDDAHHLVRVKRIEAGGMIGLFDGLGRLAAARVVRTAKQGREGWVVEAAITEIISVPRTVPRVEVWASAPKGDRLAGMIEGLSQVGAAAWHPLTTRRTVVEPGAGKIDRLERLAVESAKQCGRAWFLEIGAGGGLDEALRAGDATVILADASGELFTPIEATTVRLLVGPEGGFEPEEFAKARAAGAMVRRFGPHVMRIETAAVVAAGMVVQSIKA